MLILGVMIFMVLCLWAYFYTMGVSVDLKGAPKAKLPPLSMLIANGARTGIIMGPWIVAHQARPIRLDVGNSPFLAIQIGMVYCLLFGPLAIPVLGAKAEDTVSFSRFLSKWLMGRFDSATKTFIASCIAWVICLLPFVPSTREVYRWAENHIAFVNPVPGHLEIPGLVFIISFSVLILKFLLLHGVEWPPWMSRMGPMFGFISGVYTLYFAFNLSLLTSGLSGDNWKAPGLGAIGALLFSFATSYLWGNWDRITKEKAV
jgi:hypothetical protein